MKERAFVRLNTLYTRLRPVQWDGSYIESLLKVLKQLLSKRSVPTSEEE